MEASLIAAADFLKTDVPTLVRGSTLIFVVLVVVLAVMYWKKRK